MNDGFKLLPVMIGLYAVAEVVIMLKKTKGDVKEITAKPTGMWMS